MEDVPDRVVDASYFFFFSSRRRHTRLQGDWSSDVCSSDLRRPGPRSITESIRRFTHVKMDHHLMIEDPDAYAPIFIKAGADCVSVHQEVCQDRKSVV